MTHDPPVRLEALHGDGDGGPGGVIWSAVPGDLNVNLVALPAGTSVAAHVNDALDVLLVVVAGSGTVVVDGEAHALSRSSVLVVPKGRERSVAAGPDGIRYLTAHRARGPLTIRTGRPPG